MSNTTENYWIGRKVTKKLAKASGQSKKQVRRDLAAIASENPGMTDGDVVRKFHAEVLEPFVKAAAAQE